MEMLVVLKARKDLLGLAQVYVDVIQVLHFI